MIQTDPIFQKGEVPHIPYYDIQDMKYDGSTWKYFICNRYNSYGSGWITEDFLIKEIETAKSKPTL